jgi:hypothetical protein
MQTARLGPTQPPVHWVPGFDSRVVKRLTLVLFGIYQAFAEQ